MIETHPFGSFVPAKAKYLILGSFVGSPASYGGTSDDWFYGAKRNQFWQIIERIYNLKLASKKDKQDLLTNLSIAMTDIIYQCQRKQGNNLDSNLVNIVYNTPAIAEILEKNRIQKIYFSSRFVEKKFKKLFPNVTTRLVTLPSPSPRYAAMSRDEKIKKYKQLLPRLGEF